MHAFSGRFSRTCLEGISFNFFVCFIFNVSLGSAPKRKNFDIQCNTRVASGGQFTLNYHTPSLMLKVGSLEEGLKDACAKLCTFNPENCLHLIWLNYKVFPCCCGRTETQRFDEAGRSL